MAARPQPTSTARRLRTRRTPTAAVVLVVSAVSACTSRPAPRGANDAIGFESPSGADHCGEPAHSCTGGRCVAGKCVPRVLRHAELLYSLALRDRDLVMGRSFDWHEPGKPELISVDPDNGNATHLFDDGVDECNVEASGHALHALCGDDPNDYRGVEREYVWSPSRPTWVPYVTIFDEREWPSKFDGDWLYHVAGSKLLRTSTIDGHQETVWSRPGLRDDAHVMVFGGRVVISDGVAKVWLLEPGVPARTLALPKVAPDRHVYPDDDAAGWRLEAIGRDGVIAHEAPDDAESRGSERGRWFVPFDGGNAVAAPIPGYLVRASVDGQRFFAGAAQSCDVSVWQPGGTSRCLTTEGGGDCVLGERLYCLRSAGGPRYFEARHHIVDLIEVPLTP